ncbi:MAG: polyphosphate polymerase domain-containing protein [Prevotella sp.]|nr:polyphosphate polymerase domain-containing protein [Prevotella sp.]
MTGVLNHYKPITLEEMSNIRLLNRTDTKFVTSKAQLRRLLQLAKDDYRVQEVNDERISPYYTVYFDTPDYAMYRRHEAGHTNRQKLRIRSYVHSGLNFLEVKSKNNHGRTHKDRVTMLGFDPLHPDYRLPFSVQGEEQPDYDEFIHEHLQCDSSVLIEQIENHFSRITLVNNAKTERLTIDFDLTFDNLITGIHQDMDQVVIIELKRDGLTPSPILRMLNELRIKKMGFSKYIIGSAMTNPQLLHNRIKPNLRRIARLNAQSTTL